MVMMDNEL